MTWPASRISIAAGAAANTHRSGLARLMASLTGAGSGRAGGMSMPRESGTGQHTTPDLTARAYRLHNRRKDAAERYLSLHRTLGRGG